MSKFLPEDPREFAKFLRERTEGHAPDYDLAIFARPSQWMALAKMIEAAVSVTSPQREPNSPVGWGGHLPGLKE